MSSPEDPFSLPELSRVRRGVDGSDPPVGPSVAVPNQPLKGGWARSLRQAGFPMPVGEHAGKAAWIMPLKPRQAETGFACNQPLNRLAADPQPAFKYPAGSKDPAPASTSLNAPNGSAVHDQKPSRGCIAGRPWTASGKQQLPAMLKASRGAGEAARPPASKLDRAEGAVESRVLKLKRRQGVKSEPTGAGGKPFAAGLENKGPPGFEPGRSKLRSLSKSAPLLPELPKRRPAPRLILEACRRQASAAQEK